MQVGNLLLMIWPMVLQLDRLPEQLRRVGFHPMVAGSGHGLNNDDMDASCHRQITPRAAHGRTVVA